LRGKILAYDDTTYVGKIAGYDGNRYDVSLSNWKNDTKPFVGAEVDFVPSGEDATEVFLIATPAIGVQTSAMAITSLVLGAIGLFSSWFIFGIPSFLAVVFGHIAKSQIKNAKGALGGSELATIGLVLGYVTLALTLLIVVGFIGFIGAVAAMNE
jgi:hypothetical protein